MQKMSLAVLVVSKLIFPGYFVSCGRYACTIKHVSVKSVLLRVSLVVSPLCCCEIPVQ